MKQYKTKCVGVAYECRFCKEYPDKEECGETSPEGYLCTRKKGHAGDHVACGFTKKSHPLERWPQK